MAFDDQATQGGRAPTATLVLPVSLQQRLTRWSLGGEAVISDWIYVYQTPPGKDISIVSCEIALTWMPQDRSDDM